MEMDKLVRIILLVVGLTLAFLWLSKTFSSCTTTDTALEADIALDSENEEELFEGDAIDYSTSSVDDEPITEEIIEDRTEEVTETVDFTNPAPAKSRTTPVNTSSGTSSGGGSYMIIAGNYLLKSNAEIMTSKLKDLGHKSSYIAVFDQSQYHTVIASRFRSYESAANSANALKRQGVDCYVKKKQ
ncbi:MAG: SPOR domain-containing protein [Bacteroidia bacterium]|nr:SPOR domain-containing protein [Bacteroidia bacterium]NNK89575.1 SPOR domain-containing protein [Saprospiraceae bacterium]